MTKMRKVWSAILAASVAGSVGAAALSSDAIAQVACDGAKNPCPFQKFARDNVGTPMASGELVTVAASMEKIRKAGGPGMVNWEKFAKKTADDARANKTDDVKADCKTCHDAYKKAFQQNVALRTKPSATLPSSNEAITP